MAQHPQMFGNGRQTHLEGLGQLADREIALTQTRQHGPPSGIRQGAEGGVELL